MVTHKHIYNLLLGLDMGFGSFEWDHSQMDVHFNSNLGFLRSTHCLVSVFQQFEIFYAC
jgi:hypothetical protein